MKLLTVIGERPQFIKAAIVSRAILLHNQQRDNQAIVEEIVHTGQRYDVNMSRILFDEIGIPELAATLGSGL